MTKRLVEIDDDLLAEAQRLGGHATIKGTVTEALVRLVAEQRRREQTLREDWSMLGEALADLHDEQVMREAWS